MVELFPAGYAQPDQRSCGATCLVVAEALDSPGYAARVRSPAAFREEVLAMHRRVTSAADVTGRLQLPWPRALGTPPWAVAQQLQGRTGVRHDARLVRWSDAASAYRTLVGLPRPAALYVGSRWLPRHVVLVMEATATRWRAYEPARGQVVTGTPDAFVEHRLGLAGWDVPWFVVLPA